MSFDLRPRNKAVDVFGCGAFSWSWLLDEGVGWPLGAYAGLEPGTYLYTPDPTRRGNPHTNDGYRVTAAEAREMARLARHVAAKHRAWRDHWGRLPAAEQQKRRAWKEANPFDLVYRTPVREDFIETAEAFAAWAEQSGGFRIF